MTMPNSNSSNETTIEFRLTMDALPGETPVVTGSLPAMGSWDPKRSQLVLKAAEGAATTGKRLFAAAVAIPQGVKCQFKFVVLKQTSARWEDKIPNRDLGPVNSSIIYAAEWDKADVKVSAPHPRPTPPTPRLSEKQDSTQSGKSEKAALSPPERPQPPAPPAPPPPPPQPQLELSPEAKRHAAAIAQATQRREDVKRALQNGEQSVKQLRDAAAAATEAHGEAVQLLQSHSDCLEQLLASLEVMTLSRRERIAKHQAAIACLAEELATASSACAVAKARVEATKKARAEIAVKVAVAVTQAEEAESKADAAAATANERKSAVAAIAGRLKAHSEVRAGEASAASREKEFRVEAVAALAEELQERHAERIQASQVLQDAQAKQAVHADACRKNMLVREAELEQAIEQARAAAALRDLSARSNLAAADRQSLSSFQEAAAASAEEVNQALLKLRRQHDVAEALEISISSELANAVSAAAADLAVKERATELVATRLTEKQWLARKATSAYEAAVAVATAAREEFEALEARASGELTQEATKKEAAAARYRDAAAAARKKVQQDEAPLRHREEAEAQVLLRLEEAESKLAQAVEASRAAYEAEIEALKEEEEASRSPPAAGPAKPVGKKPELKEKVTAQAPEPRAEHKPAAAKLPESKVEQAPASRTPNSKAEETREKEEASASPKVKAAKAKADKATADVKTLPEETPAEAETGPEPQEDWELAPPSLLAEQPSVVPATRKAPTQELVLTELKAVKELIAKRGVQESSMKDDIMDRSLDWQRAKAKLMADLQLAELELVAAHEEMQASNQLGPSRVRPRTRSLDPHTARSERPQPERPPLRNGLTFR